MDKIKETDLYIPIKKHFENLGYSIFGEVVNCDMTGTLNEKIIIIELKKSFNLKLLYQLIDRKSITPFIYAGIPRPKNFKNKDTKNMIKLLKQLNIGLITVAMDTPSKNVEIILDISENIYEKVKNHNRSKRIKNEINNRNIDFNIGGSKKNSSIITAYKERSIQILCFLEKLETASSKDLILLGCENCSKILQNNYHKWFTRVSRGIYAISDLGIKALNDENYKEIVKFYRES